MESLPSQVKRLCERLTDVFCSRTTSPPVLRVKGRHGQVTSRAYWMDDARGLDEKLIGVTVTWQKPMQLILMNRLRELPLSAKQKEVCLLIGLGKSAQQITSQLGISSTTYKDHLRKIYQKLDINRRDELLLRLR
jgi:DNA-binding CsgD family transcriptional regulator